jgi:signal transduction histidine kinase
VGFLIRAFVSATHRARVLSIRLLGVVVGALVFQLPAWAGAASAADADRPRQALLLYAESRLQPAIVEADAAFRSTVSSGLGAPMNFNTEFLDLPPTASTAYQRRLLDLLQLKYEDVHFDLVVPFQIRALRFALDARAELAPGAPIVFMAVPSVGDLELPRDVSGVQMSGDSIDTLGAALRLQPETQRVVVVAGTTPLDKILLASVRAAFADGPAHLEFTYVTDLPLDAVAAKLATLPDKTIVLLVSFLQDSAGRALSTPEALERLVELSRVPIYGLSTVAMGHGIVGGRLVDFKKQGIMAGDLALRLLRGEKLGPADIVTQTTNIFMFDARQLRRWGLDESRLPPGSVILFREPLLWDRYRWPIIGALALILLESVLVAGLVVQRIRGKRLEAEAAVQRGQLAHAQRVTVAGELAATLAHEINQPLGAIVSNAEAACGLVDPAEPKRTDLLETLGDIIDDGHRASEVIGRLRAMLRTGVAEQTPCDLNLLIVEVLKFLKGDLARARVSTDLRLREDLPLVRGNAIQLQQVILNLVLNAEAAMADGAGELRRLTVETAERTPGTVEVCVRDTGVGVKEGDLEGIFKPFVSTKASGLGLGLSISRSIVEAHGGTIRADRNPDLGLSVHVKLPSDAGR